MSTMHTEERVGEAWQMHRSGNNRGAIEIFQDILKMTPRNLDALYGLGLAQRAEDHIDEAIKSFQAALDLARDALNAVNITSDVDGHHGRNDLDTYEDDRFMMLQRMISQRLEELQV